MKRIAVIVVSFGLIVGTTPAFAKTLEVGGNASASVGVGGSVDVGSETSASESEANSNASAKAAADVSVEGVGITITRASVSGNEDATVTIAAPGEVETSTDLSAYASTVVKADKNVESAELSQDAVSLRYKQRAKFLGFIPMSVYVKTTVKEDGSIIVSYPWYGFLLSQEERVSLESNLNTTVRADAGIKAAIDANAKLTSRAQALILQKVHTAMEQNLEASLAAEAKASGETNVN